MDQSHTRIFLEDVQLQVRMGHADWEKEGGKRWPLLVTVDLTTARDRWPDATIESIIDYSRVYAYLKSWEDRTHTEFLETLIEDLMAFCFRDERVIACRVRLTKPAVFPDARAGVEVFRMR